MTKSKKHEIALTVKTIIKDNCKEIHNAYIAKFGSLKGFRSYIRQECITFWTDANPYLDKEYLDMSWLQVGKKIINLDDIWCFIYDGLKEKD